eukprot:16362-Amphidinium_carterae.1
MPGEIIATIAASPKALGGQISQHDTFTKRFAVQGKHVALHIRVQAGTTLTNNALRRHHKHHIASVSEH